MTSASRVRSFCIPGLPKRRRASRRASYSLIPPAASSSARSAMWNAISQSIFFDSRFDRSRLS